MSSGMNEPLRGPMSSSAFSFPFTLLEDDPALAIVCVCVVVKDLLGCSEDTAHPMLFIEDSWMQAAELK